MSISNLFTLGGAIRVLILGGLIAVLLVLAQSCQTPKTGLDRFAEGSLKKLTVLETPPIQPSAQYLDDRGDAMRLAEYKGEIVVLNAWATWCPPCVAEMPSLDRLAADYRGQELRVIPISLDRRADMIPPFFDKIEIRNLPAWHDGSYGLNGQLKLPGLPTTVFYSRQGQELARVPGEVDWDAPEVRRFIDHLLAQ